MLTTKLLEDFWSQLEQTVEQLKETESENLSEQGERLLSPYRKRLQEIDNNLTLNIERQTDEGAVDLVFGCDGYPESIHTVLSLVDSAPQIAGVQIRAFNERCNPVPHMVNLGGELISIDEFWCSLRNINGRLELAIYLDDAPQVLDMDPRVEAAMILLDALLGEYEIMTRIWALDWFDLPIEPLDYGLIPMSNLRAEFDAMKIHVKPLGIQLH
ncbi:MAG TPA: hypothetical protein VLA39_13250 [Marinobacterium sp.]|nr:hypothetical protein [Marinobacterium sp.]